MIILAAKSPLDTGEDSIYWRSVTHMYIHHIMSCTNTQIKKQNNICGPAIVLLPSLFQQAGILPTSIGLFLITILAGICSWMMVEAMKLMPGNKDLTHRHEYMTVCLRYLSPTHYWIVFFFYQVSTMSILISNVLQTAQVFDIAIADIFGCSYGFSYYPNFGTFPCGNDISNNVEPWDTDWVISIGFCVVALISVPFGILNLDDNIILQWIATVGFGVMAIVWIVIFCQQPTFSSDHVPIATTNLSQLVGVILFNYGFIVTLPSWANEKKSNVSTTNTIIVSLGFMFFVFYIVGMFGAMAYPPYYHTDQDIFDKLTNSKGSMRLTAKVTVYLEPIIQNVTSIPIFSIVIRYNLLDAGFSKWTANFWSVIFPWTVALPLFNGNGFNDLCNWAGVVLAAYVNFILPPYLYIWAFMENKSGMSVKEKNEFVPRREKHKICVVDDTKDVNVNVMNGNNGAYMFKGDQVKGMKNPLMMAWMTYIIMWIISLVGIFFTLFDQFCDPNQDGSLCQTGDTIAPTNEPTVSPLSS